MPDVAKPHWSFWVIGILGLLWHIGTVMNFFTQLSPEGIATLPEQYRAIAETRPGWATVALAVAGFGGAIGCALMLLRRKWAIPFLWISLAGVVIQTIPALGLASAMPIGSIVLVFVLTLVVIGFLVWYAQRCARQGVIG